MQNKTILVVDDEEDLLDIISYNLKKEGFSVLVAENGRAGIELARVHLPDLIILDIMMPEIDGIEVCKVLKKDEKMNKIPIVFLTARGEERIEVQGLDLGADDFLSKPISTQKLLSRIKAVLRRAPENKEPEKVLRIDNLEIDRERFLVIIDGNELNLPKKEFELLHFLASRRGKVLDRQTLLNEVWGSNIYVIDRTVDVHVRKIREKIGDSYIETVKGVGYRFKA